jgi:hypothetical protein
LPSSSLLLQLETGPPVASPPLERLLGFVGLIRPDEYDPFARGFQVVGLLSLLLLSPRALVGKAGGGVGYPWPDPVDAGLVAPPLLFAPRVRRKKFGLTALARRLKAAMH